MILYELPVGVGTYTETVSFVILNNGTASQTGVHTQGRQTITSQFINLFIMLDGTPGDTIMLVGTPGDA